MDEFCSGKNNAYTTLDASGLSVGLPAGLMGNSEVGHLNIGAGRVVYQVRDKLPKARILNVVGSANCKLACTMPLSLFTEVNLLFVVC